MNNVSIMIIPNGFKIRKKIDVNKFIEKCMQKGSDYSFLIDGCQYILDKDNNGNVSVSERYGEFVWYNPSVEIASQTNNVYEQTVEDCIWKLRKYINAKWFTERKEW